MKVIKEQLRTVASELEEGISPSYELHCRLDGEDAFCGAYDTYESAYAQALKLAQSIAEDDFETTQEKQGKLTSIYIYEDMEGRDVTTAELKNDIEKILQNLNQNN